MSQTQDHPHHTPEDEDYIDAFKYLRGRGIVPLVSDALDKAKRLLDVPDLNDVQGDSLFIFPKGAENFIFFRIAEKGAFKSALQKFKPTSSQDVKDALYRIGAEKREALRANRKSEWLKFKQYQIAFSRTGLYVLGINDDTGDERFDKRRMRDDRVFLGDQGQWDDLFDKPKYNEKEGSAKDINDPNALHGVIIIAGDSEQSCSEATEEVKKTFGQSITISGVVAGQAREGENRGHEHFGYKDGISQPSLRGIDYPLRGQIEVDPGVVVMGYHGDPVPARPKWTKDGTIMVFRKLEQSVLLFEKYLKDNGPRWKEFFPGGKEAADQLNPPLDPYEASQLFGARLVGRWKSGAPLPLAPVRDDRALGDDAKRNNKFDYVVKNVPGVSPLSPSDHYCPFTAHIRKTAPRNLDPYISRQYLESGSIIRAGIPYGKEVSQGERDEGKDSEKEELRRGLLFVCYASHLDSGFVRQTTGYGNNDFFPITGLTPTNHGQDPIIGGPPPKGSSGNQRAAKLQPSDPNDPIKDYANGDQVDISLTVPDDPFNSFEVSGHVRVKPVTQAPPPGVPNPFFVTSRGGEYFFVPSIPRLKSWARPL